MSDIWVADDDGRNDGSSPLALSSSPIDCYVLDDVTEEDFADIICARPCTDPDCGCDGCADERYRLRDAFLQSEQPLLAESVAYGHTGDPMFWAQFALFENPDAPDQILYGINVSSNSAYSHQDERTVWAYGNSRTEATSLYESLARSPGLAGFRGWDESDVSGAPLRQPGRRTLSGGSFPKPSLRILRP